MTTIETIQTTKYKVGDTFFDTLEAAQRELDAINLGEIIFGGGEPKNIQPSTVIRLLLDDENRRKAVARILLGPEKSAEDTSSKREHAYKHFFFLPEDAEFSIEFTEITSLGRSSHHAGLAIRADSAEAVQTAMRKLGATLALNADREPGVYK